MSFNNYIINVLGIYVRSATDGVGAMLANASPEEGAEAILAQLKKDGVL